VAYTLFSEKRHHFHIFILISSALDYLVWHAAEDVLFCCHLFDSLVVWADHSETDQSESISQSVRAKWYSVVM